jgi:hypothetical protein
MYKVLQPCFITIQWFKDHWPSFLFGKGQDRFNQGTRGHNKVIEKQLGSSEGALPNNTEGF